MRRIIPSDNFLDQPLIRTIPQAFKLAGFPCYRKPGNPLRLHILANLHFNARLYRPFSDLEQLEGNFVAYIFLSTACADIGRDIFNHNRRAALF